jgi:uncharacterized beta-barrel protein YwiB (DUF1934 family)
LKLKSIRQRKVKVKIRTEQQQYGETPSVVDLVADGELIRTKQGWNVVYRESADGKMSGMITTISIYGQNVSVDRIGAYEMKMDFVEGKHHINRISTPFGAIDVGFMTNRVSCDISRNGGRIYLSYVVNYSDDYPVKTTLNISVNPTSLSGK